MKEKRVLIIAQVIPQWYVDLLTAALGENCRIDIITGSTEIIGNIIPSPPHLAESLKSRLICWIRHFIFINKWIKKNKNQKYDLIFAISNPPINSYIGLKLKKIYKAPFVYMNWDLYPQVIESSIKNPVIKFICNLWHKWNSHNYPKIDKILTIGKVMAESMKAPVKGNVNVQVVPISVDVDRLKPISKADNIFSLQNNLSDKFVVLYSGKMGMGHNIEVILEASKFFKDKTDICFVFIGNGDKYTFVERFIKDTTATNIKLFPLQAEDIFPYSMACGDIGIVAQETSMAHLFMPSKTYSMMACGEAIIAICSEHDDLNELLKSCEHGIAVANATPESVASAISDLYENKKKLELMKHSSRKFSEEYCSNDILKNTYREIFNSLGL